MLIDSRAQVSSIISGFCEQISPKIHPLNRLLKPEGPGGLANWYLGYVKSQLTNTRDKRGYNEDVLLMVIPITTSAETVPVMIGSKIIDSVMTVIMKGELVRATMTWRHTHFSGVMSQSLQLPQKHIGGQSSAKGPPFCNFWLHCGQGVPPMTMSRGTFAQPRGSPFLYLEL